MKKAIILLSGGIDSATAMYWAKEQKFEPIGLSINSYMRKNQEKKAVRNLTERIGAKLIEIDLPFMKNVRLMKQDGDSVPSAPDLYFAYIPFKNIVFMGIAGYYAEIYQADAIIVGLILDDEGKFPDDSPEYFKKLENLMKEGLPSGPWKGADIIFPLRNKNKEEILKEALKLNVPLEDTWSCYIDNDGIPCGDCLPCKQREQAFKKIGIQDPLTSKIRGN
jgi:7-cyano-7-deazaguanine synthase